MKKCILVFAPILLLLMQSCNSFSGGSGPGTLGSFAKTDISCSIYSIERKIEELLQKKEFEIQPKDSLAVDWWKSNGYEFLNYRCVNIKKRIYMITIDSNESDGTILSIRSYYNRKKKYWYVARDFTAADKYLAKKAMEKLLLQLKPCQ